jgi:streptogramin lyase
MGWLVRHAGRHTYALPGLLLTVCLVVTSACTLSPQASSTQTPTRSPTPAPGSLGHLTRFPLPPGVPGLNRLTLGPAGSLWLTAFNVTSSLELLGGHPVDDAIVQFTPRRPAQGGFTTFPLPTPGVSPDGITLGPDGALWFTEFYGNAVGRVTPQGRITEFFVPPRPRRASGSATESQPHDIVAGPDGNLWFDDFGGNKIGRITPRGVVTEFPLSSHPENPKGSGPYGVAVGRDGAVWFTELMGMRIGRITVDGRITEYKLPGVNHVPGDIVAGGDGALWFTESTQNLLGRITVDGRITEYSLPHTPCNTAGVTGSNDVGVCAVGDLVAGPDGGVWFTEGWRGALGRIDASGHITEYPVPRLSKSDSGAPQQLTLGPDCALWFTYGVGIGRVQPFPTGSGCPSTQRAH